VSLSPLLQYDCHMGCGKTLHGKDEEKHNRDECPNRVVP
jgi:hypothetical protein